VPRVVGCMMPPASAAALGFDSGGGRTHELDGLAANFDPSATVHSSGACVVARRGCMNETVDGAPTLNFDARATVAGTCYPRTWGCLDTDATNFNCSGKRHNDGSAIESACTIAANYPTQRVTDHDATICFTGELQSSNGGDGPNGDVQRILVVIESAGTIDDFGAPKQAELVRRYTAALGFADGSTTLSVSAASVNLHFETAVSDRAAYDAAAASVASNFASLDAISSALGVQALNLPIVSAINGSGDDDHDWAAIIGGGVGGLLALVLVGALALFVNRRHGGGSRRYLVTTVVAVAPAPEPPAQKAIVDPPPSPPPLDPMEGGMDGDSSSSPATRAAARPGTPLSSAPASPRQTT